jgi:hypothetical protein
LRIESLDARELLDLAGAREGETFARQSAVCGVGRLGITWPDQDAYRVLGPGRPTSK